MINNGVFTNPQATVNFNKRNGSKGGDERNLRQNRSISNSLSTSSVKNKRDPFTLLHLKQRSSIIYLNKQRFQANSDISDNIGKRPQKPSNNQLNFERSLSKRRFDGFSGNRRGVNPRRLTPSSGAPLIDPNTDDEEDNHHNLDKIRQSNISLNRRRSNRLSDQQEHERKARRSTSKYSRDGQEIRRSKSRTGEHNVFDQNVSTTRLP